MSNSNDTHANSSENDKTSGGWSWKYTVSWIRDRDNVPTLENHRRYTLLSRETFDEVEVSEAELKRGDWMPLSEVEI